MTRKDPFTQLAERAPRPRDAVLEAIRQELHQDLEKKRSLSRWERVLLSTAALVVGLGLTTFEAFFDAPEAAVLTAAALSLSVGGLLLAGVVPGEARSMGLSVRKVLVGLLCVTAFTALALKAEVFFSLQQFTEPDSLHRATACATHSLISGVLGATALLFVWRRTDPFSPGLSGAFLGLLGGAVGTTSVNLACHNAEGLHLTLAHGLSLIVFALLGVIVGRKWLSP
jgi:hypothetical protein